MEGYDEQLGEIAAIEKDIQQLNLADICKCFLCISDVAYPSCF